MGYGIRGLSLSHRFVFGTLHASLAYVLLECSSGSSPGLPPDTSGTRLDGSSGLDSSSSGSSGGSGGGSGAITGGNSSGGSSGSSGSGSGGSGSGSGSSGSGSGSSSGSGGGMDSGAIVEAGGDGPSSEAGPPPLGDAGANLVSLFDGTTLNGWIQIPAASWSVVGGAMHANAPSRGYIYTTKTYGDFRMVFSSILISDPGNHLPCVLFWGTAPPLADAIRGIQFQPPNGYMWDYRSTGPTANKSPDLFEMKFPHPPLTDKQWSQCEMLANRTTGMARFACCQLTGKARCKSTEVVDFHDPVAGHDSPIALQVHNPLHISEYKDLYIESPVADPANLITTQW